MSNRLHFAVVIGFALAAIWAGSARAGTILFIGNSFTYGQGTPVRPYRADTVTDLNREGVGGVPALFKAFTTQAGLTYDVYLETHGSAGIDWHLQNRGSEIGSKSWDVVVLQGFSMLDPKRPGDPGLLVRSTQKMATLLRSRNPAVDVWLVATWPRADMVYDPKGAWAGKSVEVMAADVRAGYDLAKASTPQIKGVVPVGEAWVRAIQSGFADANPYDGIDAGKVDLWGSDNHHASVFGYYLEALMLFGAITGRDPQSLGTAECSGRDLGLTPEQIGALQRIASLQFGPVASPGAATGILNPRRVATAAPAQVRSVST